MVSAGVLDEGQEIRLGTLTFIADDSAWLQEAPLDGLEDTRPPGDLGSLCIQTVCYYVVFMSMISLYVRRYQ